MTEPDEFIIDWKDEVQECLIEDSDIYDLAEDIYNEECNFNNADKTTGMRCFDITEIETMIEELIDWFKEQSGYCSSCGISEHEDCYIVMSQSLPLGDYYVPEVIVIGYQCPHCNEVEHY